MKEKTYCANILLAGEIGILSLIGLLIKTFVPNVVLPKLSIPTMVLLSVIPLMMECFLNQIRSKNYFVSALLGGASFSVLPWCAGVAPEIPLWKTFLIACAVFGVTSLLYEAMARRMDENGNKKAAPAVNAVLLWFAGLCLMGIL